ncbi:MAG: N-6 DNA methylase, partial [Thermoanaerobaculia bacterium]
MIDANALTRCTSREGVLALLQSLGYPTNPVEIVTAEWRRAGIDVPWNGTTRIELAARTPELDLYLISGDQAGDRVHAERFLRSLASYNAAVKPGVVCWTGDHLIIQDLSARRSLRRLEVDLAGPTIHAIDRINLLAAGTDPMRVFDRALDREQLTRQFFERFRKAVEQTGAALQVALPHERAEVIDGQALLLLSRLLFLYFIQQKGWLNGERRFVIDRVGAAVQGGRNAHATVLGPLFFGCLNTTRTDRDASSLWLGDIPYLNGGLFEPSPFEVSHPEVLLPNQLLERILEEVFEKFDFSVDENDLSGVHVDPEMLGRVFESLMAAPERLSSGTFYTPREIVDALAGRAIVEWLSDGDEPTRTMLETVLRGDAVTPPANAPQLLARLERITVLDPACGSGAFLLAALIILERIGRFLDPDAGPALRRSIIERSLYGVDLKPEAVRLCELRLWLAMVSHASADVALVQPLPNLDRNILQGNSLLSPTDFLGTGRADVYQQWVYALRTQSDLIARYRNARPVERPALARMIRATDRQMAAELIERAIELDEQELGRLALPERDLFGHL